MATSYTNLLTGPRLCLFINLFRTGWNSFLRYTTGIKISKPLKSGSLPFVQRGVVKTFRYAAKSFLLIFALRPSG